MKILSQSSFRIAAVVVVHCAVVSGYWGRRRRCCGVARTVCDASNSSPHLQQHLFPIRGGSDNGQINQEQHPSYNEADRIHQPQYAQQHQAAKPPLPPPEFPLYDEKLTNGRAVYHASQAPIQQGPYDPLPNINPNGSHQYPLPPPPLPNQYAGSVFPSDGTGYGPPDEDDLVLTMDEGMPSAPWDTTSSSISTSIVNSMAAFNKDYILKGLARLYHKKILPLELSSKYGHFHSPPLSPSDFDAPPMILLLGQYSVGKTSFVKYLLGRDFPGIRVGPEPTTDRFTAILWGSQDKIVPGAALCSQMDRPFTGLSPFGNNFLSRMEAAELNVPLLKNVTIIDTPGILSGQKQRARNYDYEAVMKWFAERADLIIVMFDAHKLDISDELKDVMQLMIPHLDKIRIVLNKADSISTQQLMRVYGALMWSLGKVMNTPEVSRVYMGSFWDAPLQNTEQAELLQREEMDLLQDITALPQQAVMRRINELVKRARSVKVHAYIIHYLRKQMPYNPWAKKEKQKRLIGRLEAEFKAAARRYGLPAGDFPALEPMRRALYEIKDLGEFPKLDKKLIRDMDKVFSVDVPELLERAKNH
jgi:GTPase SAR1 family protein